MSMSTSVYGFRPPDERFKEMLAIYKACTKAKIEIPAEVDEFFDGGEPDPAGVAIDLGKAEKEFRTDGQEGIEIDLKKLPKDVTLIRFVNSW